MTRITLTTLLFLCLFIVPSVPPPQASSTHTTCNTDHYRTQYSDLYEYSVFSEIPKHSDLRFLMRETCTIDSANTIGISAANLDIQSIQELFDTDLRDFVVTELNYANPEDIYILRSQPSTNGPPTDSQTYIQAYIGCGQPFFGQILAAIYQIDNVFSVDAIVYIGRATADALQSLPEDVTVIRLQNVSTGEDVLAIRGTDLSRIPNIISALTDSSCSFQIMEKVVEYLLMRNEVTEAAPMSIVGHSLGGVVAQYIASAFPNDPRFAAYAFGNIGRNFQVDNLNSLYNFHIQGDGLVGLFAVMGRTLSGHVHQYVPSEPLSERMEDLLPTHTHKLNTIQTALCRCAGGMGSLMVRTPRLSGSPRPHSAPTDMH